MHKRYILFLHKKNLPCKNKMLFFKQRGKSTDVDTEVDREGIALCGGDYGGD